MIGYDPDFKLLKKIGLEISEKSIPSHNLKTCESNIAGLYLCGIMMKEVLVNGVLKTPFLYDSEIISNCIYDDIISKINFN